MKSGVYSANPLRHTDFYKFFIGFRVTEWLTGGRNCLRRSVIFLGILLSVPIFGAPNKPVFIKKNALESSPSSSTQGVLSGRFFGAGASESARAATAVLQRKSIDDLAILRSRARKRGLGSAPDRGTSILKLQTSLDYQCGEVPFYLCGAKAGRSPPFF
jgi:hypothetical protein